MSDVTEQIEEQMELGGKMLIAMPGMGDPRFATSVVLMCAHSPEGAMGLIVNKPTEGMTLADILKQLEIAPQGGRDIKLHFGGPVEGARGFVLHSPDYNTGVSTLQVNPDFSMTATIDILEDMAHGDGPDQALMALGYAGWGPGQLEDEIAANGWLTCEATPEMVFDVTDDEKWAAALKSIGVDALLLSPDAGHA